MRHSERFDNAINALVSGYMNSTLAKGTCTACAVGNIIARALEKPIVSDQDDPDNFQWGEDDIRPVWQGLFVTSGNNEQIVHDTMYFGEVKKQIDITGYTWMELAKVEKAFEQNTEIMFSEYCKFSPEEIDNDQLKGLYAVVDVLCEIEGITDETEVKEYKDLFVKV